MIGSGHIVDAKATIMVPDIFPITVHMDESHASHTPNKIVQPHLFLLKKKKKKERKTFYFVLG